MLNTSHNTQPQHTAQLPKNTDTMISPRPPASSGFNFKGECDRRMSHDRPWSAQYGDAIFLRETNCFLILLSIILYAADRRARGQKVCFFSEYLCFIFGRWVESTRTDPSYPLIHFLPMPPESSSCFGMISDEGGGSAIVRLSLAARRARYVFSWYDT